MVVSLQYLSYCPIHLLGGVSEVKLKVSNLISCGLVLPGNSLTFAGSNKNWKEKFRYLSTALWDYTDSVHSVKTLRLQPVSLLNFISPGDERSWQNFRWNDTFWAKAFNFSDSPALLLEDHSPFTQQRHMGYMKQLYDVHNVDIVKQFRIGSPN